MSGCVPGWSGQMERVQHKYPGLGRGEVAHEALIFLPALLPSLSLPHHGPACGISNSLGFLGRWYRWGLPQDLEEDGQTGDMVSEARSEHRGQEPSSGTGGSGFEPHLIGGNMGHHRPSPWASSVGSSVQWVGGFWAISTGPFCSTHRRSPVQGSVPAYPNSGDIRAGAPSSL